MPTTITERTSRAAFHVDLRVAPAVLQARATDPGRGNASAKDCARTRPRRSPQLALHRRWRAPPLRRPFSTGERQAACCCLEAKRTCRDGNLAAAMLSAAGTRDSCWSRASRTNTRPGPRPGLASYVARAVRPGGHPSRPRTADRRDLGCASPRRRHRLGSPSAVRRRLLRRQGANRGSASCSRPGRAPGASAPPAWATAAPDEVNASPRHPARTAVRPACPRCHRCRAARANPT